MSFYDHLKMIFPLFLMSLKKLFGSVPTLSITPILILAQPVALQVSRNQFQIALWSFSSVQSLSPVQLFVTLWIAAHQASLFITNSWSLLRLISIKSVMPFNHLILLHLLLLLPSVFPSIRVFSNESVLHIRWPKYWNFQLQHQSFQ